MIKSMTAYARKTLSDSFGRLTIEIHSVNRKILDLSLHLPKEYLRFDMEIRKWLSKVLERGQITFRLTLQNEDIAQTVLPDQLKMLKEEWETICKHLGYDPQKMIDLRFLVEQLSVATAPELKDETDVQSVLKKGVEETLHTLMQMKETEGKALALDMQKRLALIEKNCAEIERKKEQPLAHYRKKMFDKFKELGHQHAEIEERITREVILLAEKMDVTEELVRLSTHISQFRSHLQSAEKSVGRTLEFLTQEMHREINTLGAKSADTEIAFHVVNIKSELDKIKEQVQNIE